MSVENPSQSPLDKNPEALEMLVEEIGPEFVDSLRELYEFEEAWGVMDGEEE